MCFKRTAWHTVCVGIVVAVLGTAPTMAESEPNSIESLRAAITFLTKTYGEQYPRGDDYLRRLAEIRSNNTEAYTKLQREALLNHPHVKGYDWLVEVRDQYWGNHGPINTMFQNGDINQGAGGSLKSWYSIGGRLEVLNIRDDGSGVRKKVLAEEPEGILRDADVSFDGKKILFSMRRSRDDD